MDWVTALGWLVALVCAVGWYASASRPPQTRVITDTRVEERVIEAPIDLRSYRPRDTVKRLLARANRIREAIKEPRTPSVTHLPEQTIVLIDTNGRIESVRKCFGEVPTEVTRAHGRNRSTVYKPIGQDGTRHLYRAEA